jgi:hypothetical protein
MYWSKTPQRALARLAFYGSQGRYCARSVNRLLNEVCPYHIIHNNDITTYYKILQIFVFIKIIIIFFIYLFIILYTSAIGA